jgi:hypothetical protein
VRAVVRVVHEKTEVFFQLAQVLDINIVHGGIGAENIGVLLQVLTSLIGNEPEPGFHDHLFYTQNPFHPLCNYLPSLMFGELPSRPFPKYGARA